MASAPKTSKANRSIRLTELAREALMEQRVRDGKSEWVFSTRNGTPVNCHNLIYRSWRPLLGKAGLPKIPFHNLRHTCATLLLSKGVHPKLVQELLGHAHIATTLDTYSHVIPGMGNQTVDAMEEIFS